MPQRSNVHLTILSKKLSICHKEPKEILKSLSYAEKVVYLLL